MTAPTGIRFIGIFMGIPSDGKFTLKDLPGTGKRVDVLCRSLAACFDWAPETIQSDILEFVAVLSPDRMLIVKKPPDCAYKGETWWAEVVKSSLTGAPPDFVEDKVISLDQYLQEILNEDRLYLYVLEEVGIPLSSISVTTKDSQYSFMLGNHLGFDEPTHEIIQNLEIQPISLGQLSYLGSHCVASVISHFERMVK
ncbi:MAG: hypothetical protein P1Q69_04145 [Candidatus Thorarchaeota archaeon]|nr:hypothetical protein [Candidatus Thorarchaeota archaeon]